MYDQPWRRTISSYDRPCALSTSAVTSRGLSRLSASAARRELLEALEVLVGSVRPSS